VQIFHGFQDESVHSIFVTSPTVLLQIGQRRSEQCRVLSELTDSRVAARAKQPSKFPRGMVVVDVKRFRAAADAAAVLMSVTKRVEFGERQSVT
jgi:hypothetical protein